MENHPTYTSFAPLTVPLSNVNSSLYLANSSPHNDVLHFMNSNGLLKLGHDPMSFLNTSLDSAKKLSDASGSSTTVAENELGLGKKMGEKKIKRPKVAFKTRTQVDILDDGYRWRKYGQKAVKNDKYPRSYYKCTHRGCDVKKQVQRQSNDETIVTTTYEGVHTHPIQKPNDSFEQILGQMHICPPFHINQFHA